MTTTIDNVHQIISNYLNFEDGMLLSFEYLNPIEKVPPSVQILLYARNNSLDGNIWRKVKFVINGVTECHMKIKDNRIIYTGVHLVQFGDFFCFDVDGNYDFLSAPKSLEEVQKYGECYAIGKEVVAFELTE